MLIMVKTKMSKQWLVSLGCSLTLLLSGANSWAQESRTDKSPQEPRQQGSQRDERSRGPGFNFVGAEMRFGGKTVKGAPYSATIVSETVQTLGDGTKITRKMNSAVYRDSEGRTRQEQTFSNIGPFAASGEVPRIIFINDPVAGLHYQLDPRNRSARKISLRGGPPATPKLPSSSKAKTESLGKQVIEGVEAEGTRSTVTIPAGEIGNDRALEIVSERWYAPALQIVVLSKHHDPWMGEHIYRLTNLNRSEPEHSLFELPGDYTVKESPVGHPGWDKNRKKPPEQ
jgi:hypothetical protein